MNKKGKGSGLALILLLIVALIVAYLAVTQMGNLGFAKKEEIKEDPVNAAQNVVNQINEQQQKVLDELEGYE